ncbi:hypothetical protein H0H81_010715 [Sphagnurus paluster]|uniref:tRNA-intron lyase n=1 Tax=Sphagnurus paluster TaxID=117069 RepID=A0A9P7GPS2_9AGAR|nr:hypothetical protein H0H81_010715 [Sphagnurus paluster]
MVDDVNAHLQPSLDHLKKWNSEQEDDIKRQIALLKVKGAKESAHAGRAMSPEAIQKRRVREEKRAAQAKLLQQAGGEPDSLGAMLAPELLRDDSSSVPVKETPEIKAVSVGHTVAIPASSSSLDWYDANSSSYVTLSRAREAGIWDYPSNLQERAKCGVFRSLWEQGYFMGGGIKFGGDYLVYPGDPLRYHSHFAASVLDSPVSSLRPMEIVARGRLGTATKKAHLLCGWDDEKKHVSYLTIEWAGFG